MLDSYENHSRRKLSLAINKISISKEKLSIAQDKDKEA